MSDIDSMDDLPTRRGNSNFEVLVGEEEKPVSVQLIQQVFNEVTGRAESLTESFRRSYQIEFSHINDLHARLTQTLEQFNVVSRNCGVIIYYLNNSKDEFKSFERFSFQNAGATSPVESIYLKYDFLIIPPLVRKTQAYTINIRISSGVALRRRIEEDDILNGPPVIFRLMRNRSAYLKIEYVDYSVARTMQAVVRDWFALLPHDEEQKALSSIQRRSHMIPRALRYIGTILASIICLQECEKYSTLIGQNKTGIPQITIIIFIIVYSTYVLSSWIGEYSENMVDRWSPLSYLKFNKADELEIQKYRGKNSRSIIKAVFGFIFTLGLSVLTKIIASLIISRMFSAHS
jgi:hypothetical protein